MMKRIVDSAIVEYKQRVAENVKKHWPNDPLEMKELICERFPTCREHYGYLVFIDLSGELDWVCDDDSSDQKLAESTTALIAEITCAEARSGISLDDEKIMPYKRMLGTAIVAALELNAGAAQKLLRDSQVYLQERVNEKSRTWTLLTCLSVTLCACLLCLAFDRIDPRCFWGLIGSAVSIISKAGLRDTDSNAGFCLHLLEVVSRLFVGMVLGFVGVELVNSKLAPAVLQDFCSTATGVRVLSFAAGLMDAFVPNMISQYIVVPNKGE